MSHHRRRPESSVFKGLWRALQRAAKSHGQSFRDFYAAQYAASRQHAVSNKYFGAMAYVLELTQAARN